MGRILSYAAVLILGCSVWSGSAHAQKKSDMMVKAMAKADKPDANGKQTITLTLEIEPGWHAYANPQPNPDFPARPTKVTVVGNVKADDVKIDYPKGKLKKDKMEGDYRVYEGTETIRIQIPAGKGPLTLRIEVQTCNEGMCLLPGTLTVKVP